MDIIKFKNHEARVNIHDPKEYIQKHWKRGNFYESSYKNNGVLRMVYKNYQGASFVDVGASIGNHTLFFAICCNAQSVIAIEPVEKNYNHLLENIKLNNLTNVETKKLAVGSYQGRAHMKIDENHNEGSYRMAKKGEEVEMYRLDDIIATKPDLIKIDVEEHNRHVLLGAEKVLKEFRPDIIIEAGKTQRDITDKILLAWGYRRILERYNPTPTYLYKR